MQIALLFISILSFFALNTIGQPLEIDQALKKKPTKTTTITSLTTPLSGNDCTTHVTAIVTLPAFGKFTTITTELDLWAQCSPTPTFTPPVAPVTPMCTYTSSKTITVPGYMTSQTITTVLPTILPCKA